MTIDLLETDSNAGSFDGQTDESQQKWSAYIDRFAASDDTTAADMCELAALISQQPVLLHRYIQQQTYTHTQRDWSRCPDTGACFWPPCPTISFMPTVEIERASCRVQCLDTQLLLRHPVASVNKPLLP